MTDGDGSGQIDKALPMRRPLLALAFAFAVGIWFAARIEVSSAIPWSMAGLSLFAAIVLLVRRRGGPLRFYLWLLVLANLGWARGDLPAAPSLAAPGKMVAMAGVAEGGWRRMNGALQVMLSSTAIGKPGGKLSPWPGKVKFTAIMESELACPNVLPGDEIRALVRIHKPAATRNRGTKNTREALYKEGVYWSAVGNCHDLLISHKPSLSLWRLAQRARYAMDELIGGSGDEADESVAVFSALSFGETGSISPQTRLAFQRAGMAHLLAVSGLHLGTVAIGLYLFLSMLLGGVRTMAMRVDVRRIAAALVMPALGFYVLLVGARLPAIRASVVIFCFLLAVIIRRRSDALNVLSAAWLLVLGIWPQSLFSASFQLSFAAAFSVLVLAPRWAGVLGVGFSSDENEPGVLKKMGKRFLQLALVSAAATVGTAPVLVYHFHQVSMSGLFSNMIGVPLASWLVVPVGIISAIALSFSTTLASVVASFGIWLCHGLDWLAYFFSASSWSSWNVAGLGITSLIAWYGFWISTALMWHVNRIKIMAILAAVFICANLTWVVIGPRFSKELQLIAIDVGQGDCFLIRFPGGKSWLVDGGGTYSGRYDVGLGTVAPALWALGVDRLDLVVATHRDPDHVGGLASVVKLFHPKEIWCNADLDQDVFSRPLAFAAASVGAKVRIVDVSTHVDDIEGVTIKVLWPLEDPGELEENERSIVLRFKYGKRSILLTGDLEKNGEDGLVNNGEILRSDVLKVGHHGSRNASSNEFINMVKPSLAVISVGARNHFGLPAPEVLQRLNAAGVTILRTDVDGQITISTDGQNLQIETCKDSAGRN